MRQKKIKYRLCTIGFPIILVSGLTVFKTKCCMIDRLYPTHCSHNLRSLCFTKHLKRNAFYINLEENEQK